MVVEEEPSGGVWRNDNLVNGIIEVVPVRGEELPIGAKCGRVVPRYRDLLRKRWILSAQPSTAVGNGNLGRLDKHAGESLWVESRAKSEWPKRVVDARSLGRRTRM